MPLDNWPGTLRPVGYPSAPVHPIAERGRAYVPVRVKYGIAMVLATAWLLFSIWVSQPWMKDLGNATHPVFAIVCLTFIAYAQGFMNAFMIMSLLMDRREGVSGPQFTTCPSPSRPS